MEPILDVIIVGAGPAGLTAGIYTARHGHSTLILDGRKVGGKALEAHRIENFPGFPHGISGSELMQLFHEQAKRFGVRFSTETVIGISDIGKTKIVSTRQGYYQGKAVIIATGIHRKQLSIPGEMEYKGRGVSYCAICDGPLFKKKVVAIIGSGHEAVIDSIHLADIADKVYAIPGLKGYSDNYSELEKLKLNTKVEIIEGHDVIEILGDEFVTGVKLRGGSLRELKLDGVFILLEHVTTSAILSEAGIEVDEGGCIIVDKSQQTSLPGIFAAGDCSCLGWQVITAAGDGARAALSAMKYVKQKD